MAKQSSDKISIDRMRSEAIHQDNGTITPKALENSTEVPPISHPECQA